MHQYAFDDALLLGLACQCHEAFIRIVVVGFQNADHPAWRALCIGSHFVGHEAFDPDAANGHGDDTNANAVGQCLGERAAKVIDRSQSGVLAAEWGQGFVPFSHLSSALDIVDGRHHLETVADAFEIAWLGCCRPFHVRLAKAEEYVEILVDGSMQTLAGQHHQCCCH